MSVEVATPVEVRERALAAPRVGRAWWLAMVSCVGAVGVGHFLRQLDVSLNPLAWSSIEMISALLSFTIAASLIVRFYGSGSRVSFFLGLTFAVTGVVHLAAIFEFYGHFLKFSEHARAPLSWMFGQTLLGSLLLLACVLHGRLPWLRDPGKNIVAMAGIVVGSTCVVAASFLLFSAPTSIDAQSLTPRVWELLPASIFLVATVMLNGVREDDRFAFDTAIIWVAGLNALSHLVASQSAHLLDAAASVAEVLNAVGYIALLSATFLDNAHLFRQVRTLAISDSLTGLANYRHLGDTLQSELERSGRTNRPFSVLLMDLDGLKKINDRYGHLIGSRALCRVADILRLNCRAIDTPARYGGDEFALVLPETTGFAAEHVADRIRHYLEKDVEAPHLSLSIGVATFPRNGVTAQQLLEHADQNLYARKNELRRERMERQHSA